MLDFNVYQRPDYAIGNFINCTPTIKTLSEKFGEKVPVFFASKFVKEMYLKCPFIRIIEREEADKLKTLFTSGLVNQVIPDWMFIHRNIIGSLQANDNDIPHTYVDEYDPPDELKGKKYAVIVRGGVRNKFFDKKDVGEDIYKNIIDKIKGKYEIVFICGRKDMDLLDPLISYSNTKCIYIGNMKKSLGIINGSSIMIANDTGMYHVAGALNKHIFVLWKQTNFEKNKSPGKNCFFSFEGKWKEDFDEWYKQFNND